MFNLVYISSGHTRPGNTRDTGSPVWKAQPYRQESQTNDLLVKKIPEPQPIQTAILSTS